MFILVYIVDVSFRVHSTVGRAMGGNTLHVATICLATQLFLFIVDFQQYFFYIECDGYDVENLARHKLSF